MAFFSQKLLVKVGPKGQFSMTLNLPLVPSDFCPATLQKAQSKSVHLILSNLCTLLCEHDKTERYNSAFPTVLLWLLKSQNKFILSLKVRRRHAKFYID